MKRARGTIVWLFGADGVGKTRLAGKLVEHGGLDIVSAFNGTDVSTWPDSGKYAAELAKQGIDDATNRDPEHYLDKTRNCYELAGSLAAGGGTVLIDSCPRGKTIINAVAEVEREQGHGGGRAAVLELERMDDLIGHTAAAPPNVHHLGVHVTLPNFGSFAARGAVILDRLHGREGGLSEFDPQTAAAAGDLILGGNCLELALTSQGDALVRVESMGPTDIGQLANELLMSMPEPR